MIEQRVACGAATGLEADRRRRRGRRANAWGRAAEDSVAARYRALGGRVIDRRVRNEAGEIDLVVAIGAALVFVEVKARAATAQALAAAGDWARRGAAAELYAARVGHKGDFRLDLAAVDRQGHVKIVENAGMAAAF